MSNRELVIDLVTKLPEDTPLEEIARQLEFIAGIREGLEEEERGDGISADELRKRLAKWTTESSS
jgi:predicted transcriptional regulator